MAKAGNVNETQRINSARSTLHYRKSKPPHARPAAAAACCQGRVLLVVRPSVQRLCLANERTNPCSDHLHCSLVVAVEAKARQPQIQLGDLCPVLLFFTLLAPKKAQFSRSRRLPALEEDGLYAWSISCWEAAAIDTTHSPLPIRLLRFSMSA